MALNIKLIANRRLLQSRQFHVTRYLRGYEAPGKTTLEIINHTEKQLLIHKCLPVGFKLSDMSLVVGPIAIFPNALLSWNVASGKDINEASISLFNTLDPAIDIVIIGLETVYDQRRISEIRNILIKNKLKTEILPVHQASGVFNFLINEGRYVAAGLIPPLHQKYSTSKKHVDSVLIGDKKMIPSKQ